MISHSFAEGATKIAMWIGYADGGTTRKRWRRTGVHTMKKLSVVNPREDLISTALAEQEEIIERGMQSFVEVGNALRD